MANWADDKCGLCKFQAPSALEQLTCEKCGAVGCVACGPNPGLPEGKKWCKKCFFSEAQAGLSREPIEQLEPQ